MLCLLEGAVVYLSARDSRSQVVEVQQSAISNQLAFSAGWLLLSFFLFLFFIFLSFFFIFLVLALVLSIEIYLVQLLTVCP